MFEKVIAKTQWYDILKEEIHKPYFKNIEDRILSDVNEGKVIYPRGVNVFKALELTPPDKVKVVIIGQDPYHGIDQANGLAFSVNTGIRIPPSLINIFKELNDDIKCGIPTHGSLESWAQQGVLLLNTSLTVLAHQAGSHSNIGWQTFTDAIINYLNTQRHHIVFILWGAHAIAKGKLINQQHHAIITAPHPSPLSAHRGFMGSKPFSSTNNILNSWGVEPIKWCI